MDTIAKALLQLTANDLMSRDVVSLPKEMSLRAAAHLLAQNQISGAPVVDSEGRCIGVVSATDFMHWAEKGQDASHPEAAGCDWHSAWQILDVENLPADQVGVFMTRDPVMVASETSIIALAQLMLDAHIHRVVVADDHRRPIGIVSSTDLLAAIAHTDPTTAGHVDGASSTSRAGSRRLRSGLRQPTGPLET